LLKNVAAVLVAFAVFIFSWLFLAFLLQIIGFAVVQSGYGPVTFVVIHILAMWVLCPGIGAAIAIYVSCKSFSSVLNDRIFYPFVSICSALILLLLTLQVGRNVFAQSPISEIVIFIFQAASIFFGAFVGRHFVPTVYLHEDAQK